MLHIFPAHHISTPKTELCHRQRRPLGRFSLWKWDLAWRCLCFLTILLAASPYQVQASSGLKQASLSIRSLFLGHPRVCDDPCICLLSQGNSSRSVGPSVLSDSLQPYVLQPARLLGPQNSPGLLQGIVLIQGSNPRLLHCRQILYHLSQKRSPRVISNNSLFTLKNSSGWTINCIIVLALTNKEAFTLDPEGFLYHNCPLSALLFPRPLDLELTIDPNSRSVQ